MSPIDEAEQAADLANSAERLDVVMEYFWSLPRLDWFALLGRQWTCCDNIACWRSELRRILVAASREELDAMMDAEEIEALAALPERITVYRGCYAINRAGLSWTTDRAVAERFPRLIRYRLPGQPILRMGAVRRARAVLKLNRGEQEIIAHQVRIVAEEELAP